MKLRLALAAFVTLSLVLALRGTGHASQDDLTASYAAPVRPASLTVTFANTTPITITDSGSPPTAASPYPSTINVSGVSGLITKVTVTLDGYSHTYAPDVDVLLVGPTGQSTFLVSDPGVDCAMLGCSVASNIVLTFDDAARELPCGVALVSGAYRPTNCQDTFGGDSFPLPAPIGGYGALLSSFNNTDPNGTWRLYVVDDAGGISGSIARGWSLTITTPAQVTPPATLTPTRTSTPTLKPPTTGTPTRTPTVTATRTTTATVTRTRTATVTPTGPTPTPTRTATRTVTPTVTRTPTRTLTPGPTPNTAKPAVVRGTTWYLRNSLTTGGPTLIFDYGAPTDIPLMCDWDGNGSKTPGVFRNGVWFLRNSNTMGMADIVFAFGLPGDTPICGDWDGDGRESVGIIRGTEWRLRNSLSTGPADLAFSYGQLGDQFVVGDWDGNRTDTPGALRGDTWHLRNTNSAGPANLVFRFGVPPGTQPIVGDWDGDGDDTVGTLRGTLWFLRNSNTTGPADIQFEYGAPGDTFLVWR